MLEVVFPQGDRLHARGQEDGRHVGSDQLIYIAISRVQLHIIFLVVGCLEQSIVSIVVQNCNMHC